jgi:ribonuclease HI
MKDEKEGAFSPLVTVYSDGGSDPNPGIGGWAAILLYDDEERVLTGNDPQTTNSRMELQAAIAALQALEQPSQVEFHTDSQFLKRGISEWIEKWAANNWKRKDLQGNELPIANIDLWKTLWELTKRHQIKWHWVRAHAGNVMNERVDELAREARLAITPTVQIATGVPNLYLRSSCRGNPGPGGWAVVREDRDKEDEWSGSAEQTTNNRMELTAAIQALHQVPPGEAAQLFTTSDFLFQGATQWLHGWRQRNWKKKDGRAVSNADLWQELDRLLAGRRVRWIAAKGDMINQPAALARAGELARAAAQPDA